MPGNYHIIHENARYSTRRVRCNESGRNHRHKTHDEQFVESACGNILSPNGNQFCSVAIVNPNWTYDWCHDCVRAFQWREQARQIWHCKGIETPTLPPE